MWVLFVRLVIVLSQGNVGNGHAMAESDLLYRDTTPVRVTTNAPGVALPLYPSVGLAPLVAILQSRFLHIDTHAHTRASTCARANSHTRPRAHTHTPAHTNTHTHNHCNYQIYTTHTAAPLPRPTSRLGIDFRPV